MVNLPLEASQVCVHMIRDLCGVTSAKSKQQLKSTGKDERSLPKWTPPPPLELTKLTPTPPPPLT